MLVMAQEYLRWDRSTWPDREALQRYLIKENRVTERCHRALMEGDADWGTSSTLGRNAAMVREGSGAVGRWRVGCASSTPHRTAPRLQDDLMLRPRCLDVSQWSCLPLDSQYGLYVALVDQLAATPTANLTLSSPILAQMTAMQTGQFAALLQTAHALLVAEADPVLDSTRSRIDTLLAVAAVTFLVAALVLRLALAEVRRGIERARRMLYMLPATVTNTLPTVDAYLKRGVLPPADQRGTLADNAVGVRP